MKPLFDSAIRKAGGLASFAGDESKRFVVSIQPENHYGDGHTEIGTGHFHRCKFYAIYNEITKDLHEESVIDYEGTQYIVNHIEAAHLGGKSMYLRGTLIMAEEADSHRESDGA